MFGSFLSNTDMKSGSPSFGTPESAIGLLCTGQIARRFGLPFRSGGGLNASTTVDAQAAYESLMTMLPTFLAGANFVMHSAGWLEGGLVSCYEKFIVDIELLRMLKHEFTPLEVTEESLAFDAHEEVGAGGHFLGAAHTLLHFRDCFYRPLLSSTENFDRWSKNGGLDATARAANIWRETLESTSSRRSTRASRRAARLRRPPADRARRRAVATPDVLGEARSVSGRRLASRGASLPRYAAIAGAADALSRTRPAARGASPRHETSLKAAVTFAAGEDRTGARAAGVRPRAAEVRRPPQARRSADARRGNVNCS